MKRALLLLIAVTVGCVSSNPGPRRSESGGQSWRAEADALEREIEGNDSFALRCLAASLYLTLVDYPGSPREERLDNAQRALFHANAAIRLDEGRVDGHFYRAVGIGRSLELARAPDPGMIEELEAAGLRASELDPSFKGAGTLRLLAMLYAQAPAWPIGPEDAGEDELIDRLFREAIRLAPTCAENRIAYSEYLLDEEREAEMTEHVLAAAELLPKDPLVSPFDRPDLQRRLDELLRQ
ncbi:MAG: hypothetical protein IT190_10925 [Microbacteriaceae bacterium]|nr:hypothetical protein [Microbacteriaceae bacterium]